MSVEANSYVGFGWGSDMDDTEMIAWVASGDDSSTTNYYAKSIGYPGSYPIIDPCYTNTWTVNSEAGTVDFVTTRPLDCGIPDTYVVQLDVSMSLCAAWLPSSPYLDYHGSNREAYEQLLSSVDGVCEYVEVTDHTDTYILLHGAANWIAWALIGFGQIATNRYFKHRWTWNKLAHAILGLISTGLTISAGIGAMKIAKWQIEGTSVH